MLLGKFLENQAICLSYEAAIYFCAVESIVVWVCFPQTQTLLLFYFKHFKVVVQLIFSEDEYMWHIWKYPQ